jgi:hypothetical protein
MRARSRRRRLRTVTAGSSGATRRSCKTAAGARQRGSAAGLAGAGARAANGAPAAVASATRCGGSSSAALAASAAMASTTRISPVRRAGVRLENEVPCMSYSCERPEGNASQGIRNRGAEPAAARPAYFAPPLALAT